MFRCGFACVCLLQGMPVHKSVFLVFFQGDQLRTRVKKICDGWVLGLTNVYAITLAASSLNINIITSSLVFVPVQESWLFALACVLQWPQILGDNATETILSLSCRYLSSTNYVNHCLRIFYVVFLFPSDTTVELLIWVGEYISAFVFPINNGN